MSIDLSRLTAAEFTDELSESLFDEAMWSPFVADDALDRTKVALTALSGQIRSQIVAVRTTATANGAGGRRTSCAVLDSRITETNLALKSRNKRQVDDDTVRKYATLAFELAVALEESDMAFVLDETALGDTTARDWLERRRGIEAAKARRLAS